MGDRSPLVENPCSSVLLDRRKCELGRISKCLSTERQNCVYPIGIYKKNNIVTVSSRGQYSSTTTGPQDTISSHLLSALCQMMLECFIRAGLATPSTLGRTPAVIFLVLMLVYTPCHGYSWV